MSKNIPDFTDSQIWTVESTLAERFKKKIESEIRLYPHDRELPPVSGLPVQADHARETQQESESAS